ncbi:MAG: hypothetical protein ACM3QU_08385 [Verrucomicrobiota bacterium]
MREWLEQLERTADEGDLPAVLAWLAGADVSLDEDELRAALRRALLLLAAGGDPQRHLDPGGRAVTALAADLDRPRRRVELARGLGGARAEADSLPAVCAALDRLLEDPDLAWRAYAAGLIGEELAED